jgi:muconate cycloisomerase
MRIAELHAFLVRLPLRREVKHASATRQESENILIRCRLADGVEGWGEGVPRSYVTGETPEGAMEQLVATRLGEQLDVDCHNWEDVLRLCDRFQPPSPREDARGCYGNALRCAVELSILDAFGRLFGEPVGAVTRCFQPAASVRASCDHVRYSAAITAESPRAEKASALKYRLYGFRQCKVKVGVPGADDAQRLRAIRRWIGPRMDLRLDANEAWSAGEVVAKLDPLLRYQITCIEQPVRRTARAARRA